MREDIAYMSHEKQEGSWGLIRQLIIRGQGWHFRRYGVVFSEIRAQNLTLHESAQPSLLSPGGSAQKHRYKTSMLYVYIHIQYHALCNCGAHEQPEACTIYSMHCIYYSRSTQICWDDNIHKLRLKCKRLPPLKFWKAQAQISKSAENL